MQLAYDRPKENPSATPYPGNKTEGAEKSVFDYPITITHYYYRFLPTTMEEYETITSDSVLLVSDVPFEYDGDMGSENYMDPSLVGNGTDFTYYYSIAPVDYTLPSGVAYEIIGQLHFTPEDEISDTPTETEAQAIDFYHDLNLEARHLSSDLDQVEVTEFKYFETLADANDPTLPSMTYDAVMAKGVPFKDVIIDFSEIETFEKRRRWTPSDRVTVTDSGSSFQGRVPVGVRNAEIRVRKYGWLPIRTTETDIDGSFATKHTRTKNVRYAVYFHPNDNRFTVKAGTIFYDARHIGTRKYSRDEWNQHFSGGRAHFWSLVQNASADYMFDWVSGAFNLTSPRHGIDIIAEYNGDFSSMFRPYVTGFPNPLPLFIGEIRISRFGSGVYRGDVGGYATTTHELTHAGHFQMHRSLFLGIGGIVNGKERDLLIESWAEGVETILTNFRYSSRFNRGLNHNSFRQRQVVGNQDDDGVINEYTPLFIDLNDNINQSGFPLIPTPPIDRVSGYTISQMQQCLNGSTTLVQLEICLRDVHQNPTEGNLAELFAYPAAVLQSLRDE